MSKSISEVTAADVIGCARAFGSTRKLQKYSVLVDGREYPARSLLLAAAGLDASASTNSHTAIRTLESLGFETRINDSPASTDQGAPRTVTPERRKAVEDMLAFANNHALALGDITLKELIHEGHKY